MWSTYLIVAEGDVGGEVGDKGAREVGPGGEVGGEVGDMRGEEGGDMGGEVGDMGGGEVGREV